MRHATTASIAKQASKRSAVPSWPSGLPFAGRSSDACAVVIFGASGDLTRRKLMPALYDLANLGSMHPDVDVVGVGALDFDVFGKAEHAKPVGFLHEIVIFGIGKRQRQDALFF